MSRIARVTLVLAFAFWIYWFRVRRHDKEVTRSMVEGHVMMLMSIAIELIAFIMEMVRAGSGAAILLLLVGSFVFSAGRSAYTGKNGTGRDIM